MAGRQTKTMPQQWATARALYEADKSLRDIEKATGLDYSNLAKKAKSENWQRGVLPGLILDTVRASEELTTLKEEITLLNLPQQEVVNAEVKRITGYRQRRDTIAHIAYNRIETELQNCEPFLIKQLVEATDKVGVMVEIAPRFATPGSLNLQNTVGVAVTLKDELETARKRMYGNAVNQAGS